MAKRATKKDRLPDPAELAFRVVQAITGEPPADTPAEQPAQDAPPLTPDGKNAAAVALGRLGGQKGGKARAAKLSAKERSEIAKKAAAARWKKKKS